MKDFWFRKSIGHGEAFEDNGKRHKIGKRIVTGLTNLEVTVYAHTKSTLLVGR